MITSTHKSAIDRLLGPVASVLVRLRISPTAITLTVPLFVLAACVWFVRARAVVPFCFVALFLGSLDGLDGAVARRSGQVTKLGAYLDAMMDRYVEAMVALAAALVSGYWVLIFIVLAGGMMVSYAKARAAMEVPVQNLEWPDWAERAERSLIFLAGLAAGAAVHWKPGGHDLFWWTLVGLSVLIHATVVQRMLRARRYILQRSS